MLSRYPHNQPSRGPLDVDAHQTSLHHSKHWNSLERRAAYEFSKLIILPLRYKCIIEDLVNSRRACERPRSASSTPCTGQSDNSHCLAFGNSKPPSHQLLPSSCALFHLCASLNKDQSALPNPCTAPHEPGRRADNWRPDCDHLDRNSKRSFASHNSIL